MLLDVKINGLDIKKGLLKYDNNEKYYLNVLRLYASSVRSMLKETEEFDKEKLFEYKIKIHGIKGASLDIYAESIGKEANDLERAIKSDDINYIIKNNPAFQESAGKLVSDIENMLNGLEK